MYLWWESGDNLVGYTHFCVSSRGSTPSYPLDRLTPSIYNYIGLMTADLYATSDILYVHACIHNCINSEASSASMVGTPLGMVPVFPSPTHAHTYTAREYEYCCEGQYSN